MKTIIVNCLLLAFATSAIVTQEAPYDFRATQAYAALTDDEREKLTQVRRDFALLWGALDMYADDHGGASPATLADLVPLYLPELPRDPFATEETARAKNQDGPRKSLEGWGYRYRRGAAANRAWCISSVGLRQFPFLAAEGNIGLYVCKGVWLSGRNGSIRQ